MNITRKLAKKISYGSKRALEDVKYIVLHYTGNKGDTAKANANYFATGNTREAGAHFFVDRSGSIYKSVDLKLTAWAVGGNVLTQKDGAASYHGKCKNSNSVSIEMCDCLKTPSFKQMVAVRYVVKYIQKKCVNAKTIIRHWDVTGKSCPAGLTGSNNKEWNKLKKFITTGYGFTAKVTKKAAIRKSPKVTATNKVGTAKVGEVYEIESLSGIWAKIKGTKKYITIEKLQEI